MWTAVAEGNSASVQQLTVRLFLSKTKKTRAHIRHTHSYSQNTPTVSQVREMEAPLFADARCDARPACCTWPALLPGTALVHPMHLDTGLGIDSILGELHHRPLLWPTVQQWRRHVFTRAAHTTHATCMNKGIDTQ